MTEATNWISSRWLALPGFAHSTAFILALTVVLIISVAYLTLWERKVIGWMQMRRGPNRVRLFGIPHTEYIGQPFADVVKLLIKEVVTPERSNKVLFRLAPAITLIPAFAAWAVIPIAPGFAIADVNAGLIYLLALTSMGVYGVIIAGWASNSKYAFLGAMRSAAQVVSYEIAMGFALVGGLMAAQTMNLSEMVAKQDSAYGLGGWFFIPLFPLFIVHFIAGVAETNRHPFDVAEGESEIVAGPLVEYSGMTWSLFFLAEYANMLLVATISTIMFMGGWLSPFPHAVPILGEPSVIWMLGKMMFIMLMFVWIRASFPRYRYDQIMRLGWKVFIPITIVWIIVVGVMMLDPVRHWAPFSIWFGK